MAKSHLVVDRQQPGRLRRSGCFAVKSQFACSPPKQPRIGRRIRRCNQQQELRLGGKHARALLEAALDAPWDVRRIGQLESASQSCRLQTMGILEQCEGIPARFGDDPVNDLLAQRRDDRSCKQLSCFALSETSETKLRQSEKRVSVRLTRIAYGEYQGDALRCDSARDKCQDLRGSLVQPLCVIDETEQRFLFRRFGQKMKSRQADQEPIRDGTRSSPQRHAERDLLWFREYIQVVEQWRAELVKTCEGELHLGFDTCSRSDTKVRCRRFLSNMFKQRGLADTGITTHHECTTTPGLHADQQLFDLVALRAPTQKLRQLSCSFDDGILAPRANPNLVVTTLIIADSTYEWAMISSPQLVQASEYETRPRLQPNRSPHKLLCRGVTTTFQRYGRSNPPSPASKRAHR